MIIVGQSETHVTRHTASLVSSGMLFQSRETLMTKAQPSVDCLIYILFYFNLFYRFWNRNLWSFEVVEAAFIYIFIFAFAQSQTSCLHFLYAQHLGQRKRHCSF